MAGKNKCVPCMSKDIKQLIRDNFRDPVLNEALAVIEDCPEPGQIQLCSIKKRAASPYQLFIKDCLSKHDLKGKPFGTAGKFMKECAVVYKRKSGKN